MAEKKKREEKKSNIAVRLLKRYFIDALSAMALGLFSTLIIGLILSQFSQIPGLGILNDFAAVAKNGYIVGAAIGVAVAHGLKVKPMVIFSSAVTGAIGYMAGDGLAGPVGAFVAAVIGAELGGLIAGRTKLDIVLVPLVVIITGGLAGTFVGPGVASFMKWFGGVVNTATELHPIPMGMVVALLMGLALTAPISSAAIAISLGLSGLAAGAATAGCCAHMIGFAVMSYQENRLGGLIAQGLGTSMLQIGNIMRRPQILIPPMAASVILGPIYTAMFAMQNTPEGAGMGTSGLVGQFGTWAAMSGTTEPWLLIIEIVLLQFIAPAAICLLLSYVMRRCKWIKYGDMALELGGK